MSETFRWTWPMSTRGSIVAVTGRRLRALTTAEAAMKMGSGERWTNCGLDQTGSGGGGGAGGPVDRRL
jgi:hypothetical protein